MLRRVGGAARCGCPSRVVARRQSGMILEGLTPTAAAVAPRAALLSHGFEYDLAVVGGGSGGMACAKEAAALGARVVLFDFVKPSPQGSAWGLGGTCVNVGCIPKKLMHYAGLLGEGRTDARALGWRSGGESGGESGESGDGEKGGGAAAGAGAHDWAALRGAVQNHVRSLNFSYGGALRSAGVEYRNALASFAAGGGGRALDFVGDAGAGAGEAAGVVTAAHVVLAVGGRPHVPSAVPGARELAITSDDLWSLPVAPGRTLCVGGGYVSLECAGVLRALGMDVSVCARSVLLRGFDRDCADKVGEVMARRGVRFLEAERAPTAIARREDGRLDVAFADGGAEAYDTVLYATGRRADTGGLGLQHVEGLETTASGQLIGGGGGGGGGEAEATGAHGVYAVGDALAGAPQLTPSAIQGGELLARRLFGGAEKQMDYELVPTAVFTPSEYGCVGLSEEAAVAEHGAEALDVFLWQWTSLELAAAGREDGALNCMAKVVCLRGGGRIVGLHFVGPNAGEVTQGFALALRAGATKDMLDDVVGLHPTDAEALTSMCVERRGVSGAEDWTASGGCGGGRCG